MGVNREGVLLVDYPAPVLRFYSHHQLHLEGSHTEHILQLQRPVVESFVRVAQQDVRVYKH